MKYVYSLLIALIVFSSVVNAQDEGEVVVKDRFARDKSVYVSVGPSFTLGDNLGDYKNGFSFEAGFLKRANKLISLGGNFSYLGFKYDPDKTYPYYYDAENDWIIHASLEGGDISLLSLGFNLKLNFVPVGDDTPISFYGIINPFVSYVSRKEVTGYATGFAWNETDGYYSDEFGPATYTSDDYPALEADNKFSGGAHLGLGVEFIPSHNVSFFLQATFSYTLPVSYVSSDSYLEGIEHELYDNQDGTGEQEYYYAEDSFYNEDYPIVERGFSAISVKVGVSFNF